MPKKNASTNVWSFMKKRNKTSPWISHPLSNRPRPVPIAVATIDIAREFSTRSNKGGNTAKAVLIESPIEKDTISVDPRFGVASVIHNSRATKTQNTDV